MIPELQKYFRIATALAASLGVMLLMWMPVADPFPEIQLWYEDKWEHLLVYGILTYLWFRAGLSPIRAAVGVACWSIILEFGQLWFPYRSFDLFDIAANTLGCALMLLVLRRRSFSTVAA